MGSRRRYLFVLLFVLGLVGVSALVISNTSTKLGLDLKGGVELVYQGQPTGQVTEVTSEDIERSIEIIRERIDQFGVSEPEVSRLGTDQITVSLPDVDNAQRAIDQVGTTAQLYFYDWEPNLIGPERAIGGRPGQEPPEGPLKASEKRWEDAGRDARSTQNSQMIDQGAYPTAYDAALLATEQKPVENCDNCSVSKPRFYLFEREQPHDLIAGPELAKKDLFISPTGEKRPSNGIVVEVPTGTILVSEYPVDQEGKVDKTARPGWYALKDNPALSGTDITDPKQEFDEFNEPNVTFGFTDQGREAFQEVTRQIAQRGQAQAIGPVAGEQAAALSGHFAVVLDNEVKTRPIIDFSAEPGRDRRSHRRPDLRRLHQSPGGPGPGHGPADRRPADQPQTDQPDPGLGDPRLAGARRGDQGRRDRPDPGDHLPRRLLPLPRGGRVDRPRRLRGHLLRPDQPDPDHPDPAGDRRPGADDRRRRRLQHRHLRANKGGSAGRDARCRARSALATNAGSARSSTPT